MSHRGPTLLFALALAMALGGCASSRPRSGSVAGLEAISAGSGDREPDLPSAAWSLRLAGAPGVLAPSTDGQWLFVALAEEADTAPRLCRISTEGNDERCVTLDAPVRSVEPLSRGGAVIWLRDGSLRAFDGALQQQWRVEADCAPRSLGGEPESLACFRLDSAEVPVFSGATGVALNRFTFRFGSVSSWDVSAELGIALVGSSAGGVAWVDRAGNAVWRRQAPGPVLAVGLSPPALAGGAATGVVASAAAADARPRGPRLLTITAGGQVSAPLVVPRQPSHLLAAPGAEWTALFGAGPSGQWLASARWKPAASLAFQAEVKRFAEYTPTPRLVPGGWIAGLVPGKPGDPPEPVVVGLDPAGKARWHLPLHGAAEGYLMAAQGTRFYLAFSDGRLQAWDAPQVPAN
ncbi:MAG: hypothetical protein IT285_00335 [Bdellovibrionales bacterium]|nr:hypothetical protein [Bdellovibrionales bacterium]